MEAGLSERDPAVRRRIIMVVSVMLLAFSAGHIMQNVLARDTDLAVRGLVPDAGPLVRDSARPQSLPVPPAATLTPFVPPNPPQSDRITDDPPLPEVPQEDASASPMGAPCRTSVDAVAGDAGIIWLEISAPCLSGQVVSVAQPGLKIDWRLDDRGRLSADLPALSQNVNVTVAFADGTNIDTALFLPGVIGMYRAALVWDGPQILGLNALEYDASYGDAGHIHAGAPGHATSDGTAGFLLRLGDGSGSMAEVYTLPRRDATQSGNVRLSVESEVTSMTCGRLANARAVQIDAVGGIMQRELTLTMPSCDDLGDFVSVTTLLREIRLAAR